MVVKGQLKYGDSPPMFLGTYPLTVGVQVICVCHAILCIFFIAVASSVVTVRFWDIQFRPELQVAIAAWHLLGIAIVSAAFVATHWRQSLALRVYFYYLVLATAIWCVWLVQLFHEGAVCAFVTRDKQSQRVGLSISCGLVAACWELWAVTVFTCSMYACYSVWHLGEFIAERNEQKYLFEEEEPLAKLAREGKDIGLYDAMQDTAGLVSNLRGRQHAAEAHPASWAVPIPGTQPPWGMQVRTVAFS